MAYRDRPSAFGVAPRDGEIALVRVTKPGFEPWFDLPGGGVDPGETDAQAVVREFGEETGLIVRAGGLLGRADQFARNTEGQAFDIRAALFEIEVLGAKDALKIEDDHELVWMAPDLALRRLRHDCHAWAVARWLRTRAA